MWPFHPKEFHSNMTSGRKEQSLHCCQYLRLISLECDLRKRIFSALQMPAIPPFLGQATSKSDSRGYSRNRLTYNNKVTVDTNNTDKEGYGSRRMLTIKSFCLLQPIRNIRLLFPRCINTAGLAQSVERQALNLMVEGSSPSFGVFYYGEFEYF
jgi:hypothetical protein